LKETEKLKETGGRRKGNIIGKGTLSVYVADHEYSACIMLSQCCLESIVRQICYRGVSTATHH